MNWYYIKLLFYYKFLKKYVEGVEIYFRDHRPAAEHHYLVIPKKHFEKITTLTKQDIPMIRRMEKIGIEVKCTNNSSLMIIFIKIVKIFNLYDLVKSII